MDSHLIDSAIFGSSWSTPATHDIFSERSRLRRWVRVLGALARAQASFDLIPSTSAHAISELNADRLDVAAIERGTAETSHSTLGLIHEIQRHLPESAREHVYVGATVQDITDTALSLEMAAVGDLLWDDLWHIEGRLLELADEYRSTPMSGRTHGQPGAPITFGMKVASWADEIGRSLERMTQLSSRCLVAQLGGAVGTLAFFGPDATALRTAFADELNLAAPNISWLTARDRLAEFGAAVMLSTSALARLANEVFVLQRAELGELREATTATTVGSITMPHKRNPERSEQIVTLATLVRNNAQILAETMVQEHERDARGWKAEWVTFPTLAHYGCAATSLSRNLLDGLEVDAMSMMTNLTANGAMTSGSLLRVLSERLGKHRAQEALHAAYHRAGNDPGKLAAELDALATSDEQPNTSDHFETGVAAQQVDSVVASARARRAHGPPSWRRG